GIGVDWLVGGGGDDVLAGGGDVDRLVGGGGDDVLAGGGDVDSFVFNTAAWGDDTINDFADGVEMMDMRGSGASAGTLNVVTSGTDAIVDFGTGQTITLIGQAGSIDATDFIF
ncbi:MAG: hypothetical protein HKN11_14450, partial [Rhizobiales bacterium]|nr:hypothetical protein [Hyphomicrobiales bacterium]